MSDYLRQPGLNSLPKKAPAAAERAESVPPSLEDRLKIAANLRAAAALAKELSEMRVEITPSGNEQFGARREGSHDDMVFAVALACWHARENLGPLA